MDAPIAAWRAAATDKAGHIRAAALAFAGNAFGHRNASGRDRAGEVFAFQLLGSVDKINHG